MDRVFSPLTGLAEASAAYADANIPTVLVLPTTDELHSCLTLTATPWLRVGEDGRSGIHRPTMVLAKLRGPEPPQLIISHCDQLCRATDTTIRVNLSDRTIFLSPIEIILNTKYRFRLFVWTASGLLPLQSSSPVQAIANALVTHLHDCDRLGNAWQERLRQIERTVEYRIKSKRRQIRFLQSSVANAYAHKPGSAEAGQLLDRINTIEQSFVKAVPA